MPDAEVIDFDPDRPRRSKPRTKQPAVPPGLSLAAAMDSWEFALNSRRSSTRTIEEYRRTITTFAAWLAASGLPGDVESVTADHIRRFLAHEDGRAYNKAVKKTTSPATAAKHFRNLRAFFNWLIEEEERTPPSPVKKADEPQVPEVEKPPLTDDQIRAVLGTCKGKTFENLRDEALIRLLIDSGPRRGGIAGIRYTPTDPETHDLDLKRFRLRITLKGGDVMWIPIGKKTAVAIDRYIRSRNRHDRAGETWLWVGHRGRLTGSGIYQMLRRRGSSIGLAGLHPHQFRRTSATAFLDAGGSVIDAQHVYGWRSDAMVRHYTKETARERAREAHARLSPGDRF